MEDGIVYVSVVRIFIYASEQFWAIEKKKAGALWLLLLLLFFFFGQRMLLLFKKQIFVLLFFSVANERSAGAGDGEQRGAASIALFVFL